MVALASPSPPVASRPRERRPGRWPLATLAALVVGLGVRLALGDGGVGDRSAAMMGMLLCVGVWLAGWLLAGPRTGFVVTLGLVALVDLAALPARNPTEYDDRDAYFRTDQILATRVSYAPGLAQRQPVLTVLVEPSFPSAAAQPSFGLAGQIDATPLAWDCRFGRGIQRLALPIPPGALASTGSSADVQLRLTGSPSRETDYLLVYASSRQGGPLVALVDASEAGQTTACTLR